MWLNSLLNNHRYRLRGKKFDIYGFLWDSSPPEDIICNIGSMSGFTSIRVSFRYSARRHGEFYCRYKPDLCLTSCSAMWIAWLIDKTAPSLAAFRKKKKKKNKRKKNAPIILSLRQRNDRIIIISRCIRSRRTRLDCRK